MKTPRILLLITLITGLVAVNAQTTGSLNTFPIKCTKIVLYFSIRIQRYNYILYYNYYIILYYYIVIIYYIHETVYCFTILLL